MVTQSSSVLLLPEGRERGEGKGEGGVTWENVSSPLPQRGDYLEWRCVSLFDSFPFPSSDDTKRGPKGRKLDRRRDEKRERETVREWLWWEDGEGMVDDDCLSRFHFRWTWITTRNWLWRNSLTDVWQIRNYSRFLQTRWRSEEYMTTSWVSCPLPLLNPILPFHQLSPSTTSLVIIPHSSSPIPHFSFIPSTSLSLLF